MLLRIYLISFVLCFLFYFISGNITYGPWGSAVGDLANGLISTAFLSFGASVVCTFIFYKSSLVPELFYQKLIKYSWSWAMCFFLFKLWSGSSSTYSVRMFSEKTFVFQNGDITFAGFIYEFVNPFFLFALWATFLFYRSNSKNIPHR